MKKTVFISSTYLDLKEERRKIWEILEKYDVIVKGMEDFGARKEDPLTTCMTEVEQSDIYVGIIGLRFGSEEPKSKKSYTQCEYERAVELDKEILIYLIDETNSSVTPSLIQFDKIEKLNTFKGLLREKHTIDTFSNATDLIDKVKRQFDKFLKSKSGKNERIDDYQDTKKLIDTFFLVPKAYSGREIKIKIKFIENPRPVSKNICELFNFEYGKSIVSKIEVISPKLEVENFKHIFMDYEHFDKYLNLDKQVEYEVFVKVLFKEEKAKFIVSNFIDKRETIHPEPDYDQMPEYEDPYAPYEVVKVGEGTVILRLKEIKSIR